MQDLPSPLKEEVVALCQKGMEQADLERFEPSNRSFTKVYDLLPEPKEDWKAFTWLQASRADNFFELKDFAQAEVLFLEVIEKDEDYKKNAYVRMRHAQCIFELKGAEAARDELLLAYNIGGDEVFEGEYVKYKKSLNL